MDIRELREFLEKFCLPEDKIDEFTSNKSLIVKNSNIFLTNKKLNKDEVFTNGLIFVNLQKLLPSSYLLKYIHQNTKPIKIKSEKQSLNFTYAKSLSLDSVNCNQRLVENQYYIVEYQETILGYAKFIQDQKHAIINIMNIGEYLKE
ncbi:MAG: hypothetical protein PF569_02990 [Candidatus Woesearchaeota archaeon]|jgi:hypothetical protein|nr:hypothetical protein [Candidatus Woesearchaeota archaeon]